MENVPNQTSQQERNVHICKVVGGARHNPNQNSDGFLTHLIIAPFGHLAHSVG